MDSFVRRRRSLLILAAGAAASILVVACAGRGGAGDAVGISSKGAGRRSSDSAGDGGLIDGAVVLPGAYRESFTKVNKARMISRGHAAGRWEIDVWANESALKALATRSREVPPGAIVVQEHYERSADGAESSASAPGKPTGPIMVMEKKPAGFSKEHGDWSWAIVGSQGQLVRDGVIEPCASCHDDAPMDGLFPIVE